MFQSRNRSNNSGGLAVLVLAVFALCLPVPFAQAQTALRDLSATGWQLVQILSMNDTVSKPEEGGRYSLVFGADGSVVAEAGCNRAKGDLVSFDPPALQFSALAATRALCGPGSLSERYLAELGWVRSYVYRDDHLYLATMADGSIIEFAPLSVAEATARVGSLSLVSDDVDILRGVILARLLDAYASASEVRVTDTEIKQYLARMEQRLRADLGADYDDRSSLSAEEQLQMDRMQHRMAESVVRSWKINRALYQQYGGRLIYQQMGPEPLDAYLAFLRDAHEAGRFSIREPGLEASFWAFFEDEQRHSFMPEGSDDESRAFTTPPWAGD